jgi:hypothetical protein
LRISEDTNHFLNPFALTPQLSIIDPAAQLSHPEDSSTAILGGMLCDVPGDYVKAFGKATNALTDSLIAP